MATSTGLASERASPASAPASATCSPRATRLVFLLCCCWTPDPLDNFVVSRFSLELPWTPDDVYRVPTPDGARIALGRYHARGERRFLTPVVLCHGLGANRYDLDFDEKYSLARFLARRGFETWVLELRGRGMAGKPLHTTF